MGAGHERGCAALRGGGVLAYEIYGTTSPGVPVLLVRPLGGTVELWGRFRDRLAEHQRVISFDLRGTGDSSRDPGRITTRGIAGDALTLLDHLRIERAHVFGISLGGMASTWLAVIAPDRVAKLCIASSPTRGIELSRAGIGRTLALAGCFLRRSEDVESALVEHVLSSSFRASYPDEVRRIDGIVRARPTTRSVLLHHALAALRHDATEELPKIRASSLVLAGGSDRLLGVAPVRALASAIPRASFEILACGHDLTLELPIGTATRVADFFRAGDRSGSTPA